MRELIRKILKESDFDWIGDTPENPLSISDVPQKIWVLDLTREEQKKIYDYLISLGFSENISINTIIESDKYGQKLAVLILNTDNRAYFGDDEVEALERGEEKPRPKGALGHLPFYTYGTEEQKKKQLENLKNSWGNTYGSYLEIDARVLLDLIKNNSLTESEGDFDWIGKMPSVYDRCTHFTGTNNNILCRKLDKLNYWLIDDLGLKGIINDALKPLQTISDLNDKYQEPMEILFNTGRYPDIKNVGGRLVHNKLLKAGLVLNNDGEYDYVNKLNTNFTDLAELLTELFVRGNQVDSLVSKNEDELKQYLTSIKGPLSKLIGRYFEVDELREFVRNTIYLTRLGDDAEDYASDVLERFGMKKLYQGGNGDFIDMLFGIDLIMEYKGRVITCQVKTREGALHSARKKPHYKRIDYFIAPINGLNNGIVIYNREGKSFKINHKGERINP